METYLTNYITHSELISQLIKVAFFNVMSFLLDVLTRRFEVAHASNPNYDEQSKENSTNSNRSNWVHGGKMWTVWISVIYSFSFFPAANENANYSNTKTQQFVKQKGNQAAHLLKKVRASKRGGEW